MCICANMLILDKLERQGNIIPRRSSSSSLRLNAWCFDAPDVAVTEEGLLPPVII